MPVEIVVQRHPGGKLVETQDDMDARRVHVEVDDGDATALGGCEHRQVRCRVRFSGPPAERVHRYDAPHGT